MEPPLSRFCARLKAAFGGSKVSVAVAPTAGLRGVEGVEMRSGERTAE